MGSSKLQPAPQLSKAAQKTLVTSQVSGSALIGAAITAGTITQDRVTSIVSAAIDNLRQGE